MKYPPLHFVVLVLIVCNDNKVKSNLMCNCIIVECKLPQVVKTDKFPEKILRHVLSVLNGSYGLDLVTTHGHLQLI